MFSARRYKPLASKIWFFSQSQEEFGQSPRIAVLKQIHLPTMVGTAFDAALFFWEGRGGNRGSLDSMQKNQLSSSKPLKRSCAITDFGEIFPYKTGCLLLEQRTTIESSVPFSDFRKSRIKSSVEIQKVYFSPNSTGSNNS